jgi:hypothetical protein
VIGGGEMVGATLSFFQPLMPSFGSNTLEPKHGPGLQSAPDPQLPE